jgi:hypothetical protein
MASLPEGISTALVHMDAPVSFIGEPGRLHVEIVSSASLIWAPTGTPITNFQESLDLDDGQPLEIQLPHVDQEGFEDGNGNAFTGWFYTVTVTYEKDGQIRSFPTRDFQVLVGQDDVDLALVPSGESYVPEVAPILPVTSLNGRTGAVTLTKSDVGLANADNTSDAAKPISTAAQAALNLKAPINNPTFTGTVGGVTKSMVGLANADNTADIDKPISNPVQLALNGKSNTGHTHAVADTTGLQGALDAKAPLASPAFTGTPTGITKSHVGLANVDNTSDAAKPLSNADVAALALKADKASPTFTGTVTLPATTNGLTKSNVGLANVDNTADSAKPVSGPQQTALNAKLDASARGAANGVASLDASGKLPVTQLAEAKGEANVVISANVLGTAAVNYGVTFTDPPLVFVTKRGGGAPKYIPYVTSVSTTGFTIGLYSADGTTVSTTQAVAWHAIPA